jgi:tetratricopeptide (TPR) repeat protein
MIIHTLKQQLTDSEFKQVVRALRQDAIIWSALEDIQFLNRIKTAQLTGLKPWIPANIALTYLFPNSAPRMLSALPNNLDEETKTRAAETLEALLSPFGNPDTGDDLTTAALAAIAIRERWLMLDTIEESFFKQVSTNPILWQTILSILYGLMPHGSKILEAMLNSSDSSQHLLALHVVTSQPQEISRQSAALLPALLQLSSLQRSLILRSFESYDPALTQQLSNDLLESLPEAELINGNPVQTLIDFMERTELLKMQGNYEDVLPALEQIREMTTSLQADLAAQLAQAAARGNDKKTALEAINKVSELEKNIHTKNQNITLAQIHTGTLELPSEESETPAGDEASGLANLLASARLAIQDQKTEQAQGLAQQAFNETHKVLKSRKPQPTPEFLQTLIEILLTVNLVEEAVQIGQLSQKIYPNNTNLISLYARTLKRLGKLDQAVEYATISLALSSGSTPIHRELIDSLMQKGDWIESRKEAEKLVSQNPTPIPGDIVLLAESYLQTGQPADAISACEKGLTALPENWELLCMLGKIYQWTNDFRAAERCLSKAIVHNPDKIEAWLDLAALHQKNNEPDKALEKLVSADNVNPHNPAINLRIGLAHLAQNDKIKALAAFNQAARFVQLDTDDHTRRQIGFHLGKTLFEGGYTEEAITVFEKTYKDHPTDVELATWYSQALILAADYQTAFPVLTRVIQSQEPTMESRLDYADLILKLDNSPEQAMTHIQAVLDKTPQDERARILLAKATAASDDHCAALELYQEAMQTELSRQPEYYTALIIGVAESAFKTEQPHVAITFLKEGLRQIPDNLALKKKLCQAYIQANLKPDALALLAEIQNLSSPTLQDYMWLADQAVALDELDLAAENLNLANQIAPRNTEIIVRMGYVQLENGQELEARETFSQLFEVEDVDISDMKIAAHALIGIGDPSTSIPFVERALELCNYQSKDLLTEMTKLQLQSDQHLAALETVKKHLEIEDQNAELWIIKSEILEHLGRPKAAAASIEEALRLMPTSADLHYRAARLHRTELDLTHSLVHITKANQLDPQSSEIALLSIQIFRACLKFKEALTVIRQIKNQEETLPWLLAKAELLLDEYAMENHSLADEAVSLALESNPSNLRALAIKARIHAQLGQTEKAIELFEQAWGMISSDDYQTAEQFTQTADLLSLGEAAAALNKWQKAVEIIDHLPEAGLTEPLPNLYIARTLTRQAERQQACTAVKSRFNAPGKTANSEEHQAQFHKAVENLYQLTPDSEAASQILRWEQRGGYAICNHVPYPNPSLQTANDFAAFAAASRRANQPLDVSSIPEEWLNTSLVKFQLSLSYSLTDLESALEIAEDLALSHPQDPIYLALYAQLAQRDGKSKTALDFINQALDIWRDEPAWHIIAAELSAEFKRFEQAIDHMEKASSLDRENPETLYKLGIAYMQGGLPGNGIRVLERAVNLEPLKPEYWAKLAQAHQAAEEYSPAMASIEKASKLAPKSPKFLLQAAEIAADKGSLLKRDKFIRQAIELQPREKEEIIHLTRLLLRKNDAEKAIEILDDVITHSVTPTPLLMQKAFIIRETAGIDEEIKLLVQLAKQDPQNPLILARLSAAYIQTNNFSDAIKAGQYALKNAGRQLSPDQIARIHYQIGVLFHRTGQLDQAISHLTKSTQQMPHFVDAYLEIADTLKDRRSYSKAIEYLESAIRISPEDPRAYLAAGLLYKEGKNYQESETMLKKAAALAPEDNNIKRHLASVIAMAIIHQHDTN